MYLIVKYSNDVLNADRNCKCQQIGYNLFGVFKYEILQTKK